MHPWAEHLLALQKAQLRIAMLQKQLEGIPAEKQKAIDRTSIETAALEEAKNNARETELLIRSLDSEADSLRAKKRDFQNKSTLIKSNDEYRAAIQQIQQCDAAISELEDRQLAAMETLEERRRTVAERQKALEQAQKLANLVVTQITARANTLTAQIAECEAQLPALRDAVEPEFLEPYLRQRSAPLIPQTSPVLVPLSGQSCGACHLQLTHQLQNNIRKGILTVCPACQALLYWED